MHMALLQQFMISALAVMLGFPAPVKVQSTEPYFEVSAAVRQAYRNMLELRLDAANTIIASGLDSNPNNLMYEYLAETVEFIELFVDEDSHKYESYQQRLNDRLGLLKSGDKSSPWFLYTCAELYLHRAVLRFKFGESWGAATDLNRGFKLLKRNETAFPNFAPNLKNLGILRAGVGTIPDSYMWAVKLFSSLGGTVSQGVADLQRSIELAQQEGGEDLALEEGRFLYSQALLHFAGAPEKALDYLASLPLSPQSNPLHAFILANTAIKMGEGDRAIQLLEDYRPSGDVLEIPYLDLLLGRSKLARLDADAEQYLDVYAYDYKGMNYIKEAWQKKAWYNLIKGDSVRYRQYLDSCKVHGHSNVDEDRAAQQEAEANVIPHAGLLKARLSFDGGYHKLAEEALAQVDQKQLSAAEWQEFVYRKGRIHQAQGRLPEAVKNFDRLIASHRDSELYYSCNAALQVGMIYESAGEIDKARSYFQQCIKMRPKSFRASIHQKAKAGLSRSKTK